MDEAKQLWEGLLWCPHLHLSSVATLAEAVEAEESPSSYTN